MKHRSNIQTFFIIQWAIFFILGVLAMREFLQVNILVYVPVENLMQSKRFLAFLAACIALLAGWIAFFFLRSHSLIKRIQGMHRSLPVIVKYTLSTVIICMPGLIMWLIPLPQDFALRWWMMIFFFYVSALVVVNFIKEIESAQARALILAVLMMAGGFCYGVFSRMDQVTAYPFTTYWSEGNRFFDYSVLFGSNRYLLPAGDKIQAFINWGMALPWAILFLLPKISIGFYRFWYQLVWILPSVILGFAAIENKRIKQSLLIAVIFALWSYLFVDQGPIYPPLVIAAIFTVIAARQRLPVGIILIAAISFYVRNARWTWGFAPGLWAGMLAVLSIENPSFKKNRINELVKPIALGVSGYFGGQLLPSIIRVLNRGSDLRLLPNAAASTTRQALLWDRLWPNATYPPGIVLGLVWAVLPALILILAMIIKRNWKPNWMQNLATAAVACAFLVVGIIASTKIGGGSNLHNLDMFILTVLIILSAGINFSFKEMDFSKPLPWSLTLLVILALLAPATYALRKLDRLELPAIEKIEESFSAVSNKVEEYSSQGEILFIDHRQLLTFNLVKNVPLVDDYEKKVLMDGALTGKAGNFETFYQDLAAQRFALIVNEPLNLISRGEDYAFGEENDAYVKWVTTPLFCQYEPLYTSQATSLELLVPRSSPAPDYLECDTYFNALDE